MVEFKHRQGPADRASWPPFPWIQSPQLRESQGYKSWGFSLIASHCAHKHSRPRLCYNRHFISGWNAVTRRGVWTEGREEERLATGTGHGDPKREFLPLRDPGTMLMNKDKVGALGYGEEKTRRPCPEFSKFGKRILKMR